MSRRPAEQGSALVLLPALVLVLLILAALVVDSAAVFLGQRALQSAAATAATDAVSRLDDPLFYGTGQVAIDPVRAVAAADASVAAQTIGEVELVGPPAVTVVGRQVCVALSGRVRPIIGRAIPGFGTGTLVHARATATLAGDHGTGVPTRRVC